MLIKLTIFRVKFGLYERKKKSSLRLRKRTKRLFEYQYNLPTFRGLSSVYINLGSANSRKLKLYRSTQTCNDGIRSEFNVPSQFSTNI